MPRDETVDNLNALMAASQQVRRPFEPQAFLNIAFYLGDQWLLWDGQQLYEPPLDDTYERVTDNRIQPVIRTEIARMTKTRPTWISTPTSTSDDDVSAARYAEIVMDDRWRAMQMSRKLRSVLTWARVTGAGY